MQKTHINLTLNLEQFNYEQYDLRVPKGMSIKELVNIVVQSYQIPLTVVCPSVRVYGKETVLTALQRLEDINNLHDGTQLIVELL